MLFGAVISSPRDTLSPTQTLELANIYLDNAHKVTDPYLTLVLCHDTELALSQAKKISKRFKVQVIRKGIAKAYDNLARLLDSHDYPDEAQSFFKKADELGYVEEQVLS
jgi:hypothetical protein